MLKKLTSIGLSFLNLKMIFNLKINGFCFLGMLFLVSANNSNSNDLSAECKALQDASNAAFDDYYYKYVWQIQG